MDDLTDSLVSTKILESYSGIGCIYKASEIKSWDVDCKINGKYIPARPLNSFYNPKFGRIRAAWLVLTGKLDALDWEDNN